MCQIFANQDPSRYTCQSRSLRLAGHVTSLRLETAFWDILETIAQREGTTVAAFITKLYEEVTARGILVTNLTSLLRCACLTYLETERSHKDASLRPLGRHGHVAVSQV